MRRKPNLTIPDILTVSNGLLGFLAITYIVDGRYWISYVLLILCIALDGLDGLLARQLDVEHKLGSYLDFLSDTISFLFAPALLIYSVFYDVSLGRAWESPVNALATLVPMMIVFFGMLRLGRFIDEDEGSRNYSGLPSPSLCFVVILLVILFSDEKFYGYRPFYVLVPSFLLSSLLYSKVPYPKVRDKRWVSVGSLVLIFSLLGLFYSQIDVSIGKLILVISLSINTIYVLTGPLMVDKNEG